MQTHFDWLFTAIEAYKNRRDDKLGLNLLYVLIDRTIVSSMGNETLTSLTYVSSHDQTIIVLLNFAFTLDSRIISPPPPDC